MITLTLGILTSLSCYVSAQQPDCDTNQTYTPQHQPYGWHPVANRTILLPSVQDPQQPYVIMLLMPNSDQGTSGLSPVSQTFLQNIFGNLPSAAASNVTTTSPSSSQSTVTQAPTTSRSSSQSTVTQAPTTSPSSSQSTATQTPTTTPHQRLRTRGRHTPRRRTTTTITTSPTQSSTASVLLTSTTGHPNSSTTPTITTSPTQSSTASVPQTSTTAHPQTSTTPTISTSPTQNSTTSVPQTSTTGHPQTSTTPTISTSQSQSFTSLVPQTSTTSHPQTSTTPTITTSQTQISTTSVPQTSTTGHPSSSTTPSITTSSAQSSTASVPQTSTTGHPQTSTTPPISTSPTQNSTTSVPQTSTTGHPSSSTTPTITTSSAQSSPASVPQTSTTGHPSSSTTPTITTSSAQSSPASVPQTSTTGHPSSSTTPTITTSSAQSSPASVPQTSTTGHPSSSTTPTITTSSAQSSPASVPQTSTTGHPSSSTTPTITTSSAQSSTASVPQTSTTGHPQTSTTPTITTSSAQSSTASVPQTSTTGHPQSSTTPTISSSQTQSSTSNSRPTTASTTPGTGISTTASPESSSSSSTEANEYYADDESDPEDCDSDDYSDCLSDVGDYSSVEAQSSNASNPENNVPSTTRTSTTYQDPHRTTSSTAFTTTSTSAGQRTTHSIRTTTRYHANFSTLHRHRHRTHAPSYHYANTSLTTPLPNHANVPLGIPCARPDRHRQYHPNSTSTQSNAALQNINFWPCLGSSPRNSSYQTVSEMLNRNGYPSEAYVLRTDDHYLLCLHRVPHGRNSTGRSNRPVVLLQHGIPGSSADWVIAGRDRGLAYQLADAGYDVWMANSRGNIYSLGHQDWDTRSDSYWSFSLDEMAMFDMPAVVDYILRQTQQDNLYVVTQSTGSAVVLAMLSTMPCYNNNVRAMYHLAPAVYLANNTDFLSLLNQQMTGRFQVTPELLVQFGIHRCLLHSHEVPQGICEQFRFLIGGYSHCNINQELVAALIRYSFAGTSEKAYLHYAQIVNSGLFRQFDYGPLSNLMIYSNTTPPEYDLSLVTVPNSIFYSELDPVVGHREVRRLLHELPNVVEVRHVSYFTHWDFLWSPRAPTEVYSHILQEMRQLNQSWWPHEIPAVCPPTST